LITSAVFVGVLFKAGLDVIDRDFVNAYFKNNWSAVKNRNLQLIFIIYSTLVTILWDLNIAVVTGTIFFFLAKNMSIWWMLKKSLKWCKVMKFPDK
jgi:hypothetical protein